MFIYKFRSTIFPLKSQIFNPTMNGKKFQIYVVKIPGEYICKSKNWRTTFLLKPPSQSFPHVLIITSMKREITHSPQGSSFQKSVGRWGDYVNNESNEIWTYNQLVRRQTLIHLVKLAKWLSCVVITNLYDAFDFMLLSCDVRVSEWFFSL